MLIMEEGMGSVVASAANVATNKTNPQVSIGAANVAFIKAGFCVGAVEALPKVVLGIPAHRAPASSPLLETGTVEDVLAEYGQQSS